MRLPRSILIPLPVLTLGFVVQAAMAGLLLGLGVQVALTGTALFQKGAIADTMRLAALVLALYCLFLAMRGKRRKASPGDLPGLPFAPPRAPVVAKCPQFPAFCCFCLGETSNIRSAT